MTWISRILNAVVPFRAYRDMYDARTQHIKNKNGSYYSDAYYISAMNLDLTTRQAFVAILLRRIIAGSCNVAPELIHPQDSLTSLSRMSYYYEWPAIDFVTDIESYLAEAGHKNTFDLNKLKCLFQFPVLNAADMTFAQWVLAAAYEIVDQMRPVDDEPWMMDGCPVTDAKPLGNGISQ